MGNVTQPKSMKSVVMQTHAVIDAAYNDDEDEDSVLYNTNNNDAQTPNGQVTPSGYADMGTDEGQHSYGRIEQLLKAVYRNKYNTNYLMRFKNELVDDAKIFDDANFMKMFPVNNDVFWNRLIPQMAARYDFFRKVKEHPTYANV